MKAKDNILTQPLMLLMILLLGVIGVFWPILRELVVFLSINEDFSYGLLLPLVSVYIVYQKWPLVKDIPKQSSWWGLFVLIAGLGLYIVGEIAADIYVPRLAFIISLAGIVLLLYGWRMVRFLSFPLFLLVMMIPLPQLVTQKLTLPLQLISSRLATSFLAFLGIPVYRQGNIIDLGVRQMHIVDACSGLRYILALLALGVIFCYFYQRRPWKWVVLLLVLVPATIFANAVRVAGMGIYPALLEGFWHGFSGWLIFVFCFGILAGVNYVLNFFWPPEKSKPSREEGPPMGRSDSAKPGRLWIQAAAALVVLVVSMPIIQRASATPNYPLKQGFEQFPMTIGSWKGRHVYIDPEMVAVTKSHAYLNAEYKSPEFGQVHLWITYYETQKKAGGFVHSPRGCFVGSGWEIESTKVIELEPGKPINMMLASRMGEKLLIFYWYLQRGRWLADETQNKFYMAYDGFVRRRTDGALIRLITLGGNDLERAQQRLTLFAQQLSPLLNKYISE